MHKLLIRNTSRITAGLTIAAMHVGLLPAMAQDQAPSSNDDADTHIVFRDSFESGDMSASNDAGFSWGENNRTSIVTNDKVVWNNGAKDVAKPAGRNWKAKSGDHALRFRYAAGEAWSEQRFALGKAYPELWISYWLRVPENFVHGENTPTNNKFFALWMDGYAHTGDGPTVVGSFWRQGQGNSTYSYSHAKDPVGNGHHGHSEDFLITPDHQGQWMQIVLYAKMSSKPGVHDGESRIWRRWDGEKNFELISETTGRGYHPPEGGPHGWAGGYILGWANALYAQDTEWLLDDFTVSTQSLLDIDGDGQDDAAAAPADAGD